MKLPDAIIAATAITQKLSLITRNSSNFKPILKLETVTPSTSKKKHLHPCSL